MLKKTVDNLKSVCYYIIEERKGLIKRVRKVKEESPMVIKSNAPKVWSLGKI